MDLNKDWIDWKTYDPTAYSSLIPIMNSYGNDEGISITSTSTVGSYYAYCATQPSNATQFYAAGSGVYWQIYFPYEVYVDYVELISPNYSGEYWSRPTCRMKFEGSNNNNNWYQLYSGTLGVTSNTQGIKIILSLSERSTDEPFQYYKLTFIDTTSNASSGGSGMGQIQFYGFKV